NLRSCFGTFRLAALPDGGAKRSAQTGKHGAGGARILADLTAAAAFSPDTRVDHLRRHPARLQLLPRFARNAAGVAHPGPVQPVLPATGDRRSRQGHHLEGNGDPGDIHAETAVRGVEADAALPDGDPCLCRQQRTVSAAAGEARRRECAAARQRSAVVAELAPRLWADDPLHLPSLLD